MKSCVDYRHWAGGDWTSSPWHGRWREARTQRRGRRSRTQRLRDLSRRQLPGEYRNTLFTANIHGNRLNNDGLARTPSGMKGVRRKDFLFANDSCSVAFA